QAQIMQLLAGLQRDSGMALILITHDIAIAAETADRVAVMYAGRIVETGAAIDILTNPKHPYTRGLLKSAPGERGPDWRHPVIRGAPPDPLALPAGRAFHPRCPVARDRCRTDDPRLRDLGADRSSACHFAETLER